MDLGRSGEHGTVVVVPLEYCFEIIVQHLLSGLLRDVLTDVDSESAVYHYVDLEPERDGVFGSRDEGLAVGNEHKTEERYK